MGRPKQVLKKSELAKLLSLTPGRVSQLIKLGLPVRADGRLDRQACVSWYQSRVFRRPALSEAISVSPSATSQAGGGPDLAPVGSDTAPASGCLVDLRIERERLKLRRETLDFEERRTNLMFIAEVRAEVMARATAEREALLNWPKRIAAGLAAKFGAIERDMFMALDVAVRTYLEERSAVPVPQTPLARCSEMDDGGASAYAAQVETKETYDAM
jgi:hypothetical protein